MLGRRLLFAGLCAAPFFPLSAYALNYHELEVYPYATAAKGEFELENAFVYTDQGSRDLPAPDNNQGTRRTSFEATYGVTDKTEVAAYADFTRVYGGDWEHAGDRIRARTRFLEKGELPVDLGLYVEAEFPQHEDNDLEMEVRGIIEKDFGKWTLDLNPMLEKTVKGTEASEGWELQYAAGLIYRLNERVHPRLDMFGDVGPVRSFEDQDEQKHLVSPAVDVRLGHGLMLTAGLGFGLTDATEHRLVRTKLEWEFY
jgi:hypothetical protein